MKYQVHLTASERQALKQFVACGKKQARHITRARILLLVDEGKKNHEIAELLSVSRPTICSMRKKYANRPMTILWISCPTRRAPVAPLRLIVGSKPILP